jgi:hypothetical protein
MTLPDLGERTVQFYELQIELHRDHRCRALLALIADAEEDPAARDVLVEMLHARTAKSTRIPSTADRRDLGGGIPKRTEGLGLGMADPGHWALREPAPHGEPTA